LPKRSNPFQRLIYSIQHQLSADAVVSESKLLPNLRSGSLVEVDIVIEASTGGIPLTISVECTTSTSRAATVEWVREMIGKHQDLPTDKLVLVSGSGFSHEAEEIAAAHNIETVTFDEAPAYNWSSLIATLAQSSSLKISRFDINVRSWSIRFCDSERARLQSTKNLSLGTASRIYSEASEPMGTIQALVGSMLHDKSVVERVMRKWAKDRKSELELTWTPPQGASVEDDQGNRFAFEAFLLSLHCDVESTPVSMSPAKYGDTEVAYGYVPDIFTGSTGNVLVFFTQREGEEPAGGLSFSSDSGLGKAIFPAHRPSTALEGDP
jgi:hypothetical protein